MIRRHGDQISNERKWAIITQKVPTSKGPPGDRGDSKLKMAMKRSVNQLITEGNKDSVDGFDDALEDEVEDDTKANTLISSATRRSSLPAREV